LSTQSKKKLLTIQSFQFKEYSSIEVSEYEKSDSDEMKIEL